MNLSRRALLASSVALLLSLGVLGCRSEAPATSIATSAVSAPESEGQPTSALAGSNAGSATAEPVATAAAKQAPVAAAKPAVPPPAPAAKTVPAPTPENTMPAPSREPKAGTVKNPKAGTGEYVLQQYIAGALHKDEGAGWAIARKQLHSVGYPTAASLQSYRSLNFQATRRKVRFYLADDAVPVFEIDRVEAELGGGFKVFVVNEKSMPTPCVVARDAAADNAWRIKRCSL